jgi:RecA/RadA recombinase
MTTPPAARALTNLDPETIRFSLERTLVGQLEASDDFARHRKALVPADPEKVRRRLLGDALRLTESMAPAAYRHAREALRILGATGELELYQSSGRENAAVHLVQTPILLEIQGRLLSLLDDGSGPALFGHELGHYLAHGPWTPMGATSFVGVTLAQHDLLRAGQRDLARRLSVAREVTADRFGLLACQDLHAALRLEMIATTGLAGDALTWDTTAYLAQCQEVMDATVNAGQEALASTHPEHSLRAWAVWLFSETDVYRGLTGQGSGTRTLADVDALIESVLHAHGDDSVFDTRDEPPQFLLECALACAVLVAHADGEVAPEELEAIEDAFGRTVPGWSEFLDLDVARERFYETGGLVRTGGTDLARRLFLLMSHVMGADDVVDPREVQMILSIGEALGFATQFRAWIVPAVEALGGKVDVETQTPVAIPLPARRGEIREALAAFCDGVQRQGQARISPRRLLRIAGAEVGDQAAIERVEGMLLARKIVADPPLATCPADTRLVLTAPPRTDAPVAPAPLLDDARKSVIAGLTRLRDELISGDGRSPAVRLRRVRRGRALDLFSLDAVRTGAAERALTLIRSGKVANLITPADAGLHDAAQACVEDLRLLERANLDRFEETGANDLYLGYPVVVGNVGPRGTKTPGYGVRAPLVLYPVVLERDGRGARGFSLRPRPDEDPITNQSLLRLIFNKAGLAMPDELLADLDEIAAEVGQDSAALLAKLSEVGMRFETDATTLGPYRDRDDDLDAKPPFLAIEECALLGIFPQSSSDLLQDYDALLTELQTPTRSLEDLLAAGAGLLPSALQPAGDGPEVAAPGWPVLDADPSQRDVIAECGRHRVTVVDGPPGTGKSQVIVNLVADALRRGERVAVVAEKRAALDVVFQRLDAMGLGTAAAVVHDVRDDRKALFGQIRDRLATTERRPANETRLAVLRAEHDAAEQTIERRRAVLAHTKPEAGLTVGQLLAVQTGDRDPPVWTTDLADVDRAGLDGLVELAERLHPYADLWAKAAWWRTRSAAPRPGLHRQDDAAMARHLQTIEAAIPRAVAAEAALAEAPTTAAELDAARPLLATLRRVFEATSSPDEQATFAAVMTHPAVDLDSVGAQWSQHATAMQTWASPTELASDDVLAREAAVLRSYAGRLARFFSLTWWRARGSLRRALATAWPERTGAAFDASFLQEVSDRVAAARTWRATQALFESLGVAHLSPRAHADAVPRLAALATFGALAADIRAHATPAAALGLAAPTSAEAFAATQAQLTRRQAQLSAVDAWREAVAPLATDFPGLDEPSGDALRELRERLRIDGPRLREADGWLAQLDAQLPIGRPLLDRLAEERPDGDVTQWRETITRAWAGAHLEALRGALPQLTDLGTTAEAQTVTRASATMSKLDHEIRALEIGTIQARLDDAPLLAIPDAKYRARRTTDQKLKEQLVREVTKTRRLMPLRQFARTFSAEGLLDVVPCWLVSPETMAVLFPRQPLFDLVVFDEASQCTVEAGFPVTLRAKRVVIAGDDKQMPPTSFFELGATTDDDDDDVSEAGREARDAFSAESLLVLARNRCPHVGLTWHYRCRSEELIAFSNHSMYDGDLLTIPSTAGPRAASALQWIPVADGAYDAGLNRPEAVRVVALLHELLARSPRPTVGVVAFNLKQRQTILDEIERRLGEDEAFAKAWGAANDVEGLDERPFVRNLESVQGDERDIIVFSLGHAPVERTRKGGGREQYVPARFGPLGLRGGERRLNVAISRAKRECYVVSSFDPKLLHVGSSTHSGPRLFKGYLEFAQHKSEGRHDLAERVLDEVRGSRRDERTSARRRLVDGHLPLAAQIACELEPLGFPCEQRVGSSRFQIPLAVAAPGADAFSVAILTDEGGRGVSAFDQYVHQPLVLTLRGWDVMHVDAASWSRRRAEILEQIQQRARAAVTPVS